MPTSRGMTQLLLALLTATLLAGCAGVKVAPVATRDYMASRRGDILSNRELSAAAGAGLQVVGLEVKTCMANTTTCLAALRDSGGLNDEQRASIMSELWLQEALTREKMQDGSGTSTAIDAYLESARQAYAYLFLSERQPHERALEDRQTQVRDYYNFAVQQAVTHVFAKERGGLLWKNDRRDSRDRRLAAGSWKLDMKNEVRFKDGTFPDKLIPASSLEFRGLRNQYRRDGLGAMLVAVTGRKVVTNRSANVAYSETPFPTITAVITFPGKNLAEVLDTDRALLTVYDPYKHATVELAGTSVPLAGDFTAGYGLWLARSGFASQSILSLIGKGDVLEKPRVYLMQPYDPKRRTIVMLHGLASSPEAWINVANEVLGDEVLRQNFQIWQVYYPTSSPLAFNHVAIRAALQQTLKQFDPEGDDPASRDIVLVGHSMGGLLSRLIVSSSDDAKWAELLDGLELSNARRAAAQKRLRPLLQFSPMPQAGRAIFIAAPHRGTPFAQNRVARWAARLVTLPLSVLSQVTEITQLLVAPGSTASTTLANPINGISNLSHEDPFIMYAADLPISPRVPYHSIIGSEEPDVPLPLSSDGIVPYRSAHLAGAESEKIVPSSHSVQETPAAIVEIRRILHRHLEQLAKSPSRMQ